MAAKHKFSNSHIEIRSTLEQSRLLEIGEQVAADLTTERGRMNGGRLFQFGWNIESRTSDSFVVSQGNGKKSGMKYRVSVTPTTEGRSQVQTGITFFRTSQETVFFIPVGPKKLIGYDSYKRYMVELGRAVENADPTAQVQIVERAARS